MTPPLGAVAWHLSNQQLAKRCDEALVVGMVRTVGGCAAPLGDRADKREARALVER